MREEAESAAERAESAWRANAAGRHLLAQTRGELAHASGDFSAAVGRTIRDWQGAVLDLVADEGMGKRSQARFLALGVNGVGVALMIVVFAHTGGLVGAEIGVAGGTAVLAQRVLEAVFGDQAVRRLAETAKQDLDGRVEALMAAELIRYHAVLDGLQVDPGRADQLRQAARSVEDARPGGMPSSRSVATPALGRQERRELEASAAPGAEDQATDIVDAELIEVAPSEERVDRRDWR
jgi:hypothetical protein